MCRNITVLRGLEPPATTEETEAAARQYVRKVGGIQKPSPATEAPSSGPCVASPRRRPSSSPSSPRGASPRRPSRRCAGSRARAAPTRPEVTGARGAAPRSSGRARGGVRICDDAGSRVGHRRARRARARRAGHRRCDDAAALARGAHRDRQRGRRVYYGFWSGFGADLGEVTLVTTVGLGVYTGVRRANCHVKGCWRIGHHPLEGTPYHLCATPPP